jgi:dolichyl-phosphooligosaccharide-protein glycotransferase
MNFFSSQTRTGRISIFIFTWLIVTAIGIHIRLYPLYHFTPNASSEKAALLVINRIKAQVEKQVTENYPDVPPQQRTFLTKKLFDDIFHNDKEKIRQSIDKVALQMKQDMPGEKGYPYLLASDGYYYYYLTQQIVQTGRMSPEIKGSKYFHPLMLAPLGFWEPFTIHPYSGFFVYKVIKFFNTNASLMYAVSFTPLIMTTLIAVIFLLLCTSLGFSPFSRLIGGIFFILAPIFVKRSTFGWYDDDPHNIFFPFLILTALLWGMKHVQTNLKRNIYAAVTSILLLVYALIWQGWVFIFSLIILSSFLIILYHIFILRNSAVARSLTIYFASIVLMTFFAVSAVFGLHDFFKLFHEGWTALSNFMTPRLSSWPDLYISVGELHKTPLKILIELTGGFLMFTLTLLGIGVVVIRLFKKETSPQLNLMILLIVFFLLTFKMTLGAQRFALQCLIPLSLLFICGLDFLIGLIKKIPQRLSSKNARSIALIALYALITSSVVLPIRVVYKQMPALMNKIYNDIWDITFERIRNNTPENSIVNTWWPPGHFVKAMAQRRVTFDGATINVPQAYWMLNVFSATTEKEALGILRMLNTSANQAAEYLQELNMPLSETVSLLKQIVQLDQARARVVLRPILKDPGEIDHLLSLTHGTPPPSYTLIYNEFAENSLEMSLFGRWNFKEIENINTHPELLKKVPPANSREYINFLWKLAGGPERHSEILNQINQAQDWAVFDQNLRVNLKTKECGIESEKYGKGIPFSILYSDGNTILEQEQSGATLPYSVVLFSEGERNSAILLDRKLAHSMMVRLFYLGGRGLKYFEPFSQAADSTKRTEILVYKVNWDQFEKDLQESR